MDVGARDNNWQRAEPSFVKVEINKEGSRFKQAFSLNKNIETVSSFLKKHDSVNVQQQHKTLSELKNHVAELKTRGMLTRFVISCLKLDSKIEALFVSTNTKEDIGKSFSAQTNEEIRSSRAHTKKADTKEEMKKEYPETHISLEKTDNEPNIEPSQVKKKKRNKENIKANQELETISASRTRRGMSKETTDTSSERFYTNTDIKVEKTEAELNKIDAERTRARIRAGRERRSKEAI